MVLESIQEISPYLKKNTYGICDFSFSNIFAWQKAFNTQYAVIEGYLVLKSISPDGKTRFLMPVGGEIENLKKVIFALMETAEKEKSDFEIVSASEEFAKEVEELFEGALVAKDNRDYCDYRYLAQTLSDLKGKKLHSKRNHINKFKELYPDFEYKTITAEMIPECAEMQKKWCEKNNCKEESSLDRESCAVRRVFRHFESLPLRGGALYVNSEMVAFTFGQKLTEDTFDVMIEKAFSDVQGAYTVINQMFVQAQNGEFTYINREEDLGIPGLRQAKLSYHPEKLLKKLVICRNL